MSGLPDAIRQQRAIDLDLAMIPAGVRFDGIMGAADHWLLHFTETDPNSPSYGAGFAIDPRGCLLRAIERRRVEKRSEFARGVRPEGGPAPAR